nr:orotidine-5'-phosphate decarboxylase [Saprospiraceae bacterium]
MKLSNLVDHIKEKGSFLCVGLDSDIERLPGKFSSKLEALVEFNREIIDATKEYCVAYKINTAFYERYGSAGWKVLEQTRSMLPDTHFLIADAKRGDIGNTANHYAACFFSSMNFDAVTVAPYMGRDSIEPFLGYKDKFAILLGITSNPGSADFQKIQGADGAYMYEKVIQ